jgi:hypothetical protein
MQPKHSTDAAIVPPMEQLKDKTSLLSFYNRTIALRNGSRALTFGGMKPIDVGRREICAFEREVDGESLLVVHNVFGTEVRLRRVGSLQPYGSAVFAHANASIQSEELHFRARSSLVLTR